MADRFSQIHHQSQAGRHAKCCSSVACVEQHACVPLTSKSALWQPNLSRLYTRNILVPTPEAPDTITCRNFRLPLSSVEFRSWYKSLYESLQASNDVWQPLLHVKAWWAKKRDSCACLIFSALPKCSLPRKKMSSGKVYQPRGNGAPALMWAAKAVTACWTAPPATAGQARPAGTCGRG